MELFQILDGVCTNDDLKTILGVIRLALNAVKLIIPIVLIILGTVDLSKAVISGKSDATSKQVTSLVKRIVAGVIIFFVPTIVSAAFSLVDGYSKVANKFSKCMTCLVDVSKCK